MNNTIKENTIKEEVNISSSKEIKSEIHMDDLNKQALNILQTKGQDEAIKFMFNPTGDKPLSYAEMRYRFG